MNSEVEKYFFKIKGHRSHLKDDHIYIQLHHQGTKFNITFVSKMSGDQRPNKWGHF